MQFNIVTLTTLFAAALAAPSDVSARQAPLATLQPFRNVQCTVSGGPSVPLYRTRCTVLPAGLNGGKIFDTLPAGCQILFFTDAECLVTAPTYNYPLNGGGSPSSCFNLQPLTAYKTLGSCAVN